METLKTKKSSSDNIKCIEKTKQHLTVFFFIAIKDEIKCEDVPE